MVSISRMPNSRVRRKYRCFTSLRLIRGKVFSAGKGEAGSAQMKRKHQEGRSRHVGGPRPA